MIKKKVILILIIIIMLNNKIIRFNFIIKLKEVIK